MKKQIDYPDVHDEEDLVGNLKREQSIKSLSSCSKIGPSESMMMLHYHYQVNRDPYESTSRQPLFYQKKAKSSS